MIDDWQALVDGIRKQGGYVGSIVYKDVPGAGRGLFLEEGVEASTRLVSIPESALITTLSLAPQYPKGLLIPHTTKPSTTTLTSTQALAMHLLLKRHSTGGDPYLDTLPESFDEHPLTWVCREDDATFRRLASHLTPSSLGLVKEIQGRCLKDWKAVSEALISHNLAHISHSLFNDFVWSWLCVNTRSIHYSLSPSQPKRSKKDIDLTLCPIIDFANHTVDPSHACEVRRNPSDGSLELWSSVFPMSHGEEVLLHYSSYPNATLFAEYGFVVDGEEGVEVRVDEAVKVLFKGDDQAWRRELLEERGYWGDWSLHASPTPAHPSYRLIPPLRLLHIQRGEFTSLSAWEATLQGSQETVHAPNEREARATLRAICESVHHASKLGRSRLSEIKSSPWTKTLHILWKEEEDVSLAVMHSIDSEYEF